MQYQLLSTAIRAVYVPKLASIFRNQMLFQLREFHPFSAPFCYIAAQDYKTTNMCCRHFAENPVLYFNTNAEWVVTLLHYCMQLYVLMISFSEIKVCLLTCICRFKNKAHYFQLSLQRFISGGRSALDLQRHLKVTVDGKALSLPSLQGIVFLNIPSWAAGADIWGTTHDEVTMWERGVWWVYTSVVFHIQSQHLAMIINSCHVHIICNCFLSGQ